MNLKVIIVIAALVVAVVLIMMSGNIEKNAAPAPHQTEAVEHGPDDGHNHAPAPKQTSELATVKSLIVSAKNVDGKEWESMSMVPGVKLALDGTDYSLLATDFYTYWNFANPVGAINLSFELQNPAVKIEVYKGESLVFYQWAFQSMPYFGLEAGHGGDAPAKDVGFTLISFDGLSIPDGNNSGATPHE